jgi:hypothetical protein
VVLKVNRRFERICRLGILDRRIRPVRQLREAESQISSAKSSHPTTFNVPVRCLCVDSVRGWLGTETVLKEVDWKAASYFKASAASPCVTNVCHRRLGNILSEVKLKINLFLRLTS